MNSATGLIVEDDRRVTVTLQFPDSRSKEALTPWDVREYFLSRLPWAIKRNVEDSNPQVTHAGDQSFAMELHQVPEDVEESLRKAFHGVRHTLFGVVASTAVSIKGSASDISVANPRGYDTVVVKNAPVKWFDIENEVCSQVYLPKGKTLPDDSAVKQFLSRFGNIKSVEVIPSGGRPSSKAGDRSSQDLDDLVASITGIPSGEPRKGAKDSKQRKQHAAWVPFSIEKPELALNAEIIVQYSSPKEAASAIASLHNKVLRQVRLSIHCPIPTYAHAKS